MNSDHSLLDVFNLVVSRIIRAGAHGSMMGFDVDELHELRARLSGLIIAEFAIRPDDLRRYVKDTSLPVGVRASAAFHMPSIAVGVDRLDLLDGIFEKDSPVGDTQIRFQYVIALQSARLLNELSKFQDDPSQLIRDIANELK